jgi:hypothetical protein
MKEGRSWRWHLIRLELAAAIGPPAVIGALFLLAPDTSGPMFRSPPDPLFASSIIALGIALYLIGLVWMLRIYRADPEAHPSSWRSHHRD